jgi:hypothetical protein
MRFLLLDTLRIINDDADLVIGKVSFANGSEGPLRVFAHVTPRGCGTVEVATVTSFDECLVTLADYYEGHPPQWGRRNAARYEKETLYSSLRVEQDQRAGWRVYRNGYPMLQGSAPASFHSLQEAQRVADAHLLDNYPNAPPTIDDGYCWLFDPQLDWRLLPFEVEGRARWKPLATFSLPTTIH